jgi:transposase
MRGGLSNKKRTIADVIGGLVEASKSTPGALRRHAKVEGLNPQRRRVMGYYCGLDVSVETTAICIVDDQGVVVYQASVDTDPGQIGKRLRPYLPKLKRVGHEAGSLSPWLHPELLNQGLPAVCLETRHIRAALSAQRNKTDAADALGIAHIMRTGWYKSAHIKSEDGYRMRLLLIQRRNLKRKFLDIENTIRHSLKAFGIRLGGAGRGGFETAVRTAVKSDPMTTEMMDAMLSARAALWLEYTKLHALVIRWVSKHEVCRRFMEIPGVGPVAAMTFLTAIDDPSRFKRSRDVAAYFGLTSKRWQSGTSIDINGRISKAGDPDARRALYEAASALLVRFKGRDKVKAWGQMLAKRSCHQKACVAVARKLAVIMHAMWTDGTFYVGDTQEMPSDRERKAKAKRKRFLGAHA